MSKELVVPATGPLSELLNAADGSGPMLPRVGGDALAETVMRDGMSDGDDDSPPAIHLAGGTGGIRVLRDPSLEAEARRRRAMRGAQLGAPPQSFPIAREQQPAFNPGYMQPSAPPTPMTIQQGLIIGGVDFNHRAIVTNHGIIPLPEDVGQKVLGIALNAVRDYFAESMRQTMQTYGMTRKPVKRKKRKAAKRGANANLPPVS